jgi:hypothetical protein
MSQGIPERKDVTEAIERAKHDSSGAAPGLDKFEQCFTALKISKEQVQQAARGTGVDIGWRLELFTANLNTMLADAIHATLAAQPPKAK